jgi:hypothetical protein
LLNSSPENVLEAAFGLLQLPVATDGASDVSQQLVALVRRSLQVLAQLHSRQEPGGPTVLLRLAFTTAMSEAASTGGHGLVLQRFRDLILSMMSIAEESAELACTAGRAVPLVCAAANESLAQVTSEAHKVKDEFTQTAEMEATVSVTEVFANKHAQRYVTVGYTGAILSYFIFLIAVSVLHVRSEQDRFSQSSLGGVPK